MHGRDLECVCVSGSNWDELVLMGLYGMFGVISVWGLFWCAGCSGAWLGLLPSTAAPLHFHSCALSHPPSPLQILSFPLSVIRENEWVFVFPPILPPSQHCNLTGPPGRPSPFITLFHSKDTSKQSRFILTLVCRRVRVVVHELGPCGDRTITGSVTMNEAS